MTLGLGEDEAGVILADFLALRTRLSELVTDKLDVQLVMFEFQKMVCAIARNGIKGIDDANRRVVYLKIGGVALTVADTLVSGGLLTAASMFVGISATSGVFDNTVK